MLYTYNMHKIFCILSIKKRKIEIKKTLAVFLLISSDTYLYFVFHFKFEFHLIPFPFPEDSLM